MATAGAYDYAASIGISSVAAESLIGSIGLAGAGVVFAVADVSGVGHDVGKFIDSIKGDSDSEKTVTNSAGQDVTRKYAENQEKLLKKAEEAAGGNLDDFTEIKLGWYQNGEGTVKIEWNPESHT